jgi:aminoglycoside phosphotransferase (APT) family kinase protein
MILQSPHATLTNGQLRRLGGVLEAALGHPVAPIDASLIAGGRSNLTYRLTSGDRQWILRRPPMGHVLETAHDMGREYRIIAALRGTAVPVPATVCRVEDTTVLGAPFYIMEFIDGFVYRTEADMRALDREQARAMAYAFIEILAHLHLVDVSRVGLADFGRPTGYLQRQIDRWTKQLAASRSRDVPGFTQLTRRLGAHIPRSSRSSIVHGDFRLDNAIVDQHDPAIIKAILDWEMSTVGDPLSDLGLFYLYWEGWRGIDNPIAATPSELPGYPAWSELANHYATRTGSDLENFSWYQAFAMLKLAVICEGIHYRHVQRLTVGDGFDKVGAMVPELVQRGLSALEG